MSEGDLGGATAPACPFSWNHPRFPLLSGARRYNRATVPSSPELPAGGPYSRIAMAEPRYLPNAPIVESLLDVRVKLAPDFDAGSFNRLREQLAEEYPNVEEQNRFEGVFKLGGGVGVESFTKSEGLHGLIFKDAEAKKIAQFRVDGFTFSRMSPYTTWDDVRDEARRLWELYSETAGPEAVTRIAVRYINHMKVPTPFDFGDYLVAPPIVPDELPQELAHFKSQLLHSFPEETHQALVTQELKPDAAPGSAILVLDIDVSEKGEFLPEGEEMWVKFEELRNTKNQIFFASITEETVSMFI